MTRCALTSSATLGALSLALATALVPPLLRAYPPAVGILGRSRNCLACHVDNGPWKDAGTHIIDILDQASGKSLRQPDGTFFIACHRGEARTVLTVLGMAGGRDIPAPHRNAWLYVDPERIADPSTLDKFAPGWGVNLPMSCRLVGDSLAAYPGASITVLPMTLRPGDDAQDAEVELQVMLTKGESVKGRPAERMVGSYFERRVSLRVLRDKAGG